MPLPANPCAAELAHAIAATLGVPAEDVKIDPPPRPELGDFAVPCFALAKLTKEAPPAVAARLARDLPRAGLVIDATAAGPFVNVRIDRTAAFAIAIDGACDRRRLVPDLGGGAVVCIDYSSPNISKHLAYHHIRSTMLGHALVQLHQALGYRVVRINHLGDWAPPTACCWQPTSAGATSIRPSTSPRSTSCTSGSAPR
jgi:arginyl-tRNA synthetase